MSYMKRYLEDLMEQMHDCYYCDSSFNDVLDLIAHLKEVHPLK